MDLSAYEKRALEAEKQIAALTAKVDALEKQLGKRMQTDVTAPFLCLTQSTTEEPAVSADKAEVAVVDAKKEEDGASHGLPASF